MAERRLACETDTTMSVPLYRYRTPIGTSGGVTQVEGVFESAFQMGWNTATGTVLQSSTNAPEIHDLMKKLLSELEFFTQSRPSEGEDGMVDHTIYFRRTGGNVYLETLE